MITAEALASIKILWRKSDCLSLYGIPYLMREGIGQSPRHLYDAYHRDPDTYRNNMKGWIWLGTPGWYGSLTKPEIELVKTFLASVQDDIPDGPYEWSILPQKEI